MTHWSRTRKAQGLAWTHYRLLWLVIAVSQLSVLSGCAMRGPLEWEPDKEPKPYSYHLAKWSQTGASYQNIPESDFSTHNPFFSSIRRGSCGGESASNGLRTIGNSSRG